MNKIHHLKALRNPAETPCLALIDLQREYTTGHRLPALSDIEPALENCRRAFEHAKTMGFPVAYFRQYTKSPFFNRLTAFSGWIDGFGPTGADLVFERDRPSCYSNKAFAELMESCGGNFVIAGFAGETACLSTAIDAYHRNHQFKFLSDASASHAIGSRSGYDVHEGVTDIMQVYGEVLDTYSWISQTSDIVFVGAK